MLKTKTATGGLNSGLDTGPDLGDLLVAAAPVAEIMVADHAASK